MAKTNFQIFNEENTPERTYNDSEYKEATQRLGGVMPGMALSRMHNKMYYQWSSMCKAIADFIVSQGYDCMDNDVTGISAAIGRAIAGSVGNAITTHNSAPDAHENRFSQYLPLTGGVMTGAIVVGNCPGMRKATDSEELYFYGGTTNQDGAALGLLGINYTAYGEESRGSFALVAKSPLGEKHILSGLKDGRLLWDGKPIVYPEEIITWQSPTGEEWYYAIRWADGRAEIHGHAIQKANNLGITLNYPIPLVSGITGEATVVAKAGSAFTALVSFTFGTSTVGYFTVRHYDYSVPTEPISICFTVRGYWK